MINNCYFCGEMTDVRSYNITSCILTVLTCDFCKIIFGFYNDQLDYIENCDHSVTTHMAGNGNSTYDPIGNDYKDEIIKLPNYFLCDLDNLEKLDMIKIFS